MKYIFLVIILYIVNVYPQITTTKSAEAKLDKTVVAKDSSKDYFGKDVMQYFNRKVYLNQLSQTLREYGYNKIFDYLPKEEDYDQYNYDEVAGKYYLVTDVIPASFGFDKYFLKMQQDGTNKIYYYEYDTTSDAFFKLILVDHFDWLKNKYVGTKVYSKGVNPYGKREGAFDYITGKQVDFSTGTEWTIKEITIEDKYYSLALIIENAVHNRLLIEERWLSNPRWLLTETNYNYLNNKYPEYLELVLNSKIKIGMPKEVAILSWGEPKTINKANYKNLTQDQWVYNNQYLYFENGILTGAN